MSKDKKSKDKKEWFLRLIDGLAKETGSKRKVAELLEYTPNYLAILQKKAKDENNIPESTILQIKNKLGVDYYNQSPNVDYSEIAKQAHKPVLILQDFSEKELVKLIDFFYNRCDSLMSKRVWRDFVSERYYTLRSMKERALLNKRIRDGGRDTHDENFEKDNRGQISDWLPPDG